MVPDDIRFIYATYLRGLYHGNEQLRKMDSDSFFDWQKKVLETVLSSSDVSIRVACDSEEKDLILAYAIYTIGDESGVYWAWTRPSQRQQGLQTKLAYGLNITHVNNLTRDGDRVIMRKKLTYKPRL